MIEHPQHCTTYVIECTVQNKYTVMVKKKKKKKKKTSRSLTSSLKKTCKNSGSQYCKFQRRKSSEGSEKAMLTTTHTQR